MDRKGKICSQLRLLIWTSFIGQLVPPLGEKGMDEGNRYFSQL